MRRVKNVELCIRVHEYNIFGQPELDSDMLMDEVVLFVLDDTLPHKVQSRRRFCLEAVIGDVKEGILERYRRVANMLDGIHHRQRVTGPVSVMKRAHSEGLANIVVAEEGARNKFETNR